MTAPPRAVNFEDVDDVIGLAVEMAQSAEGKLTVAELEDVARQLDIPARHVAPAVAELRRRRDAERRERLTKRRGARIRLAIIAAALLGLAGYSLSVRADLKRLDAEAQKARSQWQNVLERQAAVKARYENAPPSPERDAELDGAENRVRIERERYDRAVTEYNVALDGPLSRTIAGLSGLEERRLSSFVQ